MLNQLIFDLKTYYSIYFRNKKLFPNSIVKSYVNSKIKIGADSKIKEGCTFSEDLIEIGKCTYIGNGAKFFNCSEIGNFTSISHDVKIGLDNHELNKLSTSPKIIGMTKSSPTIIGHDVLISANVVILSGLKIGTGAVIGANSFVNKDVPPYAIVVGSPAKVKKYRFRDKDIEILLKSKWWEIDISEIKGLLLKNSKIENLIFELNKRIKG